MAQVPSVLNGTLVVAGMVTPPLLYAAGAAEKAYGWWYPIAVNDVDFLAMMVCGASMIVGLGFAAWLWRRNARGLAGVVAAVNACFLFVLIAASE